MSILLQDQRIQHLLPSILSEEIKLPKVLQSIIHGGGGTARGGGCNDAFSVFAFLAFLLALLQLMQDMGDGRKKREVGGCLHAPHYQGDTRLREGTMAAYTMFTGIISNGLRCWTHPSPAGFLVCLLFVCNQNSWTCSGPS